MKDDNKPESDENNRLSKRLKRYTQVGTGLAPLAVKRAASKLWGGEADAGREGQALAKVLGGLKGPVMKVAQLVATIPGLVPEEMAREFSQLQANAPPMGVPFVKRRMKAELGPDWQQLFSEFDLTAAAAASLGQVHRAISLDGKSLACKLQYPDMSSTVEADIKQLNMAFALYKSFDKVIDPSEISQEISERLREELDYEREAKHIHLYAEALKDVKDICVPKVYPDLSTGRLLVMDWLEGEPLLNFISASQEVRNDLSTWLFKAWWVPLYKYGIIHGDPHLGNYAANCDKDGAPDALNLYDYGSVRIFKGKFISGVIELYRGLQNEDEDRIVAAYEAWGFKGLSKDVIEILNLWARFVYLPLLTDQVFKIRGDDGGPTQYGRSQAIKIHAALKEKGPILVPREFVLMDRAALGLGGVFTHLDARLNFYRLFNEVIEGFDVEDLSHRQTGLLKKTGLEVSKMT